MQQLSDYNQGWMTFMFKAVKRTIIYAFGTAEIGKGIPFYFFISYLWQMIFSLEKFIMHN